MRATLHYKVDLSQFLCCTEDVCASGNGLALVCECEGLLTPTADTQSIDRLISCSEN